MCFGDRIKLLREENGLSQNDLAKKLNLTRATISKYENISEQFEFIKTLVAMSELFDVPIDYLLAQTDCREKYPAPEPIKEVNIQELMSTLSVNEQKAVYEIVKAKVNKQQK